MKEDVVLRWLKKAENDLKAVKYLLTFEDAPTDVICFYCQKIFMKYASKKNFIKKINILHKND